MARRKGGVFLPLDVHFMDDARIVEAGERAGWLYLAMMLRSKALLLDGELSRAQVQRLAIPGTPARMRRLVDVGAVVETASGLLVSAWLNHNDPADVVLAKRKADSDRKKDQIPTGIRPASEGRGRGRERVRTPLPPATSPPELTALCSEHGRDSKSCPWCREAAAI